MSYRVMHQGIVIEATDVASVVALVSALGEPRQPVTTQSVVRHKPVSRMAKATASHPRSFEGRQVVADRRARLLTAIQTSGPLLAHELSERLTDYPKAFMFNDLLALEKGGQIARGDRGYRAAVETDPLAMGASSDRFAGSHA